jgi:hypothetical protein
LKHRAPRSKGRAWAIAITVAITLGLCGYNTFHDPAPMPGDIPAGAEHACLSNYVSRLLKHPETAKFSNVLISRPGSGYILTGDVAAQNEFGSYVQTTFSCEVERHGERWTLIKARVN